MADIYERALRWTLRWPRLVIGLALLAVVPGWLFFQNLKSGFMPDMDEGAFILDYFLPVGTSLAQTDRVAQRIDKILDNMPDVAGYLRRTGAENGIYATEVFRGDIEVALKPPGKRRPMSKIFQELRKELGDKVPEAKTELAGIVLDQINDLTGVVRPVEVKVFGPDAATLRGLALTVSKLVEEAGAKDVNANVQLGNPDLFVLPKREAIARMGLNESDVDTQLDVALHGQVAATLPQQDRITDIRVRYPDAVRFDRNRLAQLPIALPAAVAAKSGPGETPPAFVTLSQLATIELQYTPNETWRENQQPMISVTGQIAGAGDDDDEGTAAPAAPGQDLGSVQRKLQASLASLKMPPGYRWELGGDFRARQESFISLGLVLLSASALVFLLLGFQFRSLALPLLIFLSQPISLASALGALWITGTPLNVSSLMGAILLIGLDVKNGIILIEYIGQLLAEGYSLQNALVHAGRIRFRPILMTSLATILGLLPLACGFGPGAQMQQPLAIAVIGGLTVNMLVTRLLIPVGYLLVRGR